MNAVHVITVAKCRH